MSIRSFFVFMNSLGIKLSEEDNIFLMIIQKIKSIKLYLINYYQQLSAQFKNL